MTMMDANLPEAVVAARRRSSAEAVASAMDRKHRAVSASLMSALAVPTIDLSADKGEVARRMWDAALEVGFFYVVNHGIPQEQIDAAFAASEGFFAHPRDEKERRLFDTERNSGYEYMTHAPPSTGVADQKESMEVTTRKGCMDEL
ncbi:hypothetical protein ACHAWF_007790 [Thalassiosira exigua]